MNWDKIIKEAYETAKEKGWHETERSSLEYHALIHSEIAEFTEEVRVGNPPIYITWEGDLITPESKIFNGPNAGLISPNGWTDAIKTKQKPEGMAIELVDVCIRVCDYFGAIGYIPFFDNKEGLKEAISHFKKFFENPLHFASFIHAQLAQGFDHKSDMVWMKGLLVLIEDYFEFKCWDLEEAIRLKMSYNKTRSYRHDGKAY